MYKYILSGGLYPSNIYDEDELNETLENYISDILNVDSSDMEVYDVSYVKDSIHGDSFGLTFNTSLIVDKFITKTDTPLAYKLLNDGYLIINIYSDISIESGSTRFAKYYDGTTLDAYSDTPYDVDMQQLYKESEIIGNKIINILKNHDTDILNIIYNFVVDDEYDDFED